MRLAVLMVILLGWLGLSGCSTTERGSDENMVGSGFLEGWYGRMRPGSDDEGLRVYRNPKAPAIIRNSEAIVLAPVQLWLGDDSGLTKEQAGQLAEYFYATLYKNLAEDYRMLEAPEPGALYFEVALTGAEGADVTRDIISKTVAPARLLSTAASKLTGEPMFQGSAAIEAKISEAASGEVLVASMDRRVGGNAINTDTLKTWGDVYAIMDFWAASIRFKLCSARGSGDCQAP